ncbi:MAG: M28 family peptidase [Gemmatimonadales bacterium]
MSRHRGVTDVEAELSRTLRRWPVAVMLAATVALHAQEPAHFDSLPAIDKLHLFGALAVLAADSMEGRKAGTPGGERARAFLLREFAAIGLQPAVKGFTAVFSAGISAPPRTPVQAPRNTRQRPAMPLVSENRFVTAVNLLGVVRGTVHPDRYIVVSAHYDHVGIVRGEIYNGADDNASGSAAIFAIAEWAIAHPPENSLLFAWFDAEEEGLLGSAAFVAHPPVPLEKIAADVNLDMVSRSARGELFAAGARRWPVMQPLIDSLVLRTPVTLRQGHDGGSDEDDWTHRSDMGPFHDKGIPFISFDVEEHPDYHRPTDVVSHIHPEFYYWSVRTIAEFIRRLDASLDGVEAVRRGVKK